ncbi:hypothetical protein DERF_010195 [Dermatophagoides farinae]|uniref:ITPR-interacting domain-containing protein n=1 Tax=Dermatophagoides farinae TaxID=6954 RepID=A0A922L2B2_DERFA|nr:hypothetical protein DERF_010195 [Dermatophagoides farinae]
MIMNNENIIINTVNNNDSILQCNCCNSITPSSSSSNLMINFDYNNHHHHHPHCVNQRIKRLSLSNQLFSSINSDSSCSSYSSIESLLESRRENPEQILLALGFGRPIDSLDHLDPLNRIPYRFFMQQSNCKGVNVNDFIRLLRESEETSQIKSSYYFQIWTDNDFFDD